MRNDIQELEDVELLRKYKVVSEYLANILLEINKRKLTLKNINSNFPQHLSSSDLDDKTKSSSVKILVKHDKGKDKDTDKCATKLESLTKNDLKIVLDENKITYKVNIKKEELIDLVRKHFLVRQAIKNNKNSKI